MHKLEKMKRERKGGGLMIQRGRAERLGKVQDTYKDGKRYDSGES